MHPRADPAPPLLLLAAVAALRARTRLAGRRAARASRTTRSCRRIFPAAADASRATYTELLARLEAKFADQPNAALRRKQARQAARAVLPNATETRIVVTGNYRAWRHFIAMRASEHADVEIRRLAIACLRQLVDVAPAVFADFEITTLADGTEVATSPLATEA